MTIKDDRMVDIEAMAEKIAAALFAKMKEALDRRDARIATLEATLWNLPAPKDGVNGKDAEPVDYSRIDELLHDYVAKAVDALPPPKDGKDGAPVDPKLVADLVSKAVADVRLPTVDDVQPLVVAEVEKAMAEIPMPRNGLNGIDGAPGQDGQDGDIGPAGRDALEIEILGEIDATRSYSRGTYAKHNNGLWRSFANTEGMKGWECLVAGVASMIVEATNEREFTVKSFLSDGTVTQETFALPVMIYRGGLVEGKQYDPGDVVTWAGHTWHCNVSTDEKPLDGGKAWTMCVRRGRDGKEGPPGPSHARH